MTVDFKETRHWRIQEELAGMKSDRFSVESIRNRDSKSTGRLGKINGILTWVTRSYKWVTCYYYTVKMYESEHIFTFLEEICRCTQRRPYLCKSLVVSIRGQTTGKFAPDSTRKWPLKHLSIANILFKFIIIGLYQNNIRYGTVFMACWEKNPN